MRPVGSLTPIQSLPLSPCCGQRSAQPVSGAPAQKPPTADLVGNPQNTPHSTPQAPPLPAPIPPHSESPWRFDWGIPGVLKSAHHQVCQTYPTSFPFLLCNGPQSVNEYGSRQASQVVLVVKNPSANVGEKKRCRFYPWVGKIPCKRVSQPIPVFLPREPHGQRSLVGYTPWGCKEPDTTDKTGHTHGSQQ